MNPVGLAKAGKRLERAKLAFVQVQQARDWTDFEPAWSDFLLASNAIYSIIEQAAKSSPKGNPWFGTKKKERKDDPLLSYMHHARNSDEHGIEPIAQDLPFLAGPFEETGHVVSMSFDDGRPVGGVFRGESGIERDLKFSPPKPSLIRVFDRRYGDSFDPPDQHLGRALEKGDPYVAGAAFIVYLEDLIASAATFPES